MSRLTIISLTLVTVASVANAESSVEDHVPIPTPPGFHVESSELDGPVFADEDGRTLYTWPSHKLRNGYSGETPGTPACYDEVSSVTAGLMSPYPAGVILPELDARPSCTDLWPPVLADAEAEAVGRWSVVERSDGAWQWAFDEQPLYTSARDLQPGDVLGGTSREYGGDSPAYRVPIGPPPRVPPGFAVKSTLVGRMLTTDENYSVYRFEQDTADVPACTGECTRSFRPIVAPALARPAGQWSVLERSPGVRQWVYRGKPLYTYVLDRRSWSQEGSDVPGWSNVLTQPPPDYPDNFTVQDALAGRVLADRHGKTIYIYECADDSIDQLSCDHPDDTQVYRLAMCGGGDAARCQEHWPYVRATDTEMGQSRSWSVIEIDPMTGRRVDREDTAAIRVWAYRDRPVYTYGGDERPGDVNGDGTGEWRGQRNGLAAYWLRDDYMGRAL